MEEYAARRCAPKTLERYQDLGRYLAKHLGDTRINELTTAQIQHAIHRLKDVGGQIPKSFPTDGRLLQRQSATSARYCTRLSPKRTAWGC